MVASGLTSENSINSSVRSVPSWVFAIVSIFALVWGWQVGLESYISPEYGLGYALGIVGGTMMLVMLLYSLRKRIRFMRRMGSVKYWFQMHMMFGVLGPICILYHCAFSLGSTNSNIALYSMLLVAASGLVGRYIYRQIHQGLFGTKESLGELKREFISSLSEIELLIKRFPSMETYLFRLDIPDERQSLFRHFITTFSYTFKTRWSYFIALKAFSRATEIIAKKEQWGRKERNLFYRQGRKKLGSYYFTLRKVVGFQYYERLFALWHVLHIPLFIMLIITGVVHVFAVHLY